MKKQIKISFLYTSIATLSLGIVYPTLVSTVGFFIPSPAPSLLMWPILNEEKFQGRPSIHPEGSSGASNLSLTNPELWQQVERRLAQQIKYSSQNPYIFHEMVFASGSGCEPYISEQGALQQISRIAQIRNINKKILRELLSQHIQPKLWGFVGSKRVNVILLNEALEDLTLKMHPHVVHEMFRTKQ